MKLRRIYRIVVYIFNYLLRFRKFKRVGIGTKIHKPIRIVGGGNISIGRFVIIWHGLRMEAIDDWFGIHYNPQLIIQDRVIINQNCHITCAGKIIIGEGTSILPDVLITDIEHEYIPGKSLMETGLMVGSVEIAENVTIGMGAKIISGGKHIKIGANAVIGANSVVTKDVPEKTIVAGVPAKIIRSI